MTPLIGGLVEQGLKIVNKFIKDPEKAAEHEFKLRELEQKGDLAELQAYVTGLMGQIEVNKIEAASSSLFKSGWRPAVGWVCATAFAYKFVVNPFLVFALLIWLPNYPVANLPEIEWVELSTILLGMLGLSHHRTAEKKEGVN